MKKTLEQLRDRSGGSALLLAVVVVVLLVMMGAAYLQIARMDRSTTAIVDTRGSFEEGSILRYIGGILRDDVISIRLDNLSTGTPTNPNEEPYDYPHSGNSQWTVLQSFGLIPAPGPADTATVQAVPPRVANVPDDAGNLYASGNFQDDTWLASIEPEFGQNYPLGGTYPAASYWPHITNLTGVFLDLGQTVNYPGIGEMPRQYLSSNNNNPNSGDTQLDFEGMQGEYNTTLTGTQSFRFGDADADGIADSRWTWAPLPSDRGVAYVMAVRIIDNSGLIDINTWQPQSLTGDVEGPRWLSPGDLNLNLAYLAGSSGNEHTILHQTGRNVGTGYTNRLWNWVIAGRNWLSPQAPGDDQFFANLLERNSLASPTPAEPYVNGGEVLALPAPNPATTNLRFSPSNELEFRWRNGLNRATDNTSPDPDAQVEAVASTAPWQSFFRTNALERVYSEMAGGTAASHREDFFRQEPRKMLTVYAGSSDLGRQGRVNLSTGDIDDIHQVILDGFTEGQVPSIVSDPNQFGGSTADFADRFAAITADFRDTDLTISEYNGQYGMEYLPFISEIYVQARYESSVSTGTGTNVPGSDVVTWTVGNPVDDHAVVIELCNPWPTPIELPDVELFVGGTSWGRLRELISPAPSQLHMLPAFHRFWIYKDDAGAAVPLAAATTIDTTVTAPGPVQGVEPIAGSSWPDAGGTFDIELRVDSSGGSPVTYQRVANVPSRPAMGSSQEYISGSIPNAVPGFWTYHRRLTANGLNAAAVLPNEDVSVTPTVSDAPPAPGYLNGIATIRPDATPLPPPNERFDQATKNAIVGTVNLDTVVANAPVPPLPTSSSPYSVGVEPWIIGNADKVYRAGDLFRFVLLGPTSTQTLAQVWRPGGVSPAPDLTEWMLDPTDTVFVNNDSPDSSNYAVNHAIYWLNRFSTLNPASDGIDNNGDGTPDDLQENLVPGRINLNTAPRRVLENALPFLGNQVNLAQAILDHRADPTGPSSARQNKKGIAYVGELLYDGNYFSGDRAATQSAGIPDFNEYEVQEEAGGFDPTNPSVGVGYDSDRFQGDRKEQTALVTAINQVASTRSDVFTAYVHVRGYPANDFTNSGTYRHTEEYWLIATFDRSNITVNAVGEPLPRLLNVVVIRPNG